MPSDWWRKSVNIVTPPLNYLCVSFRYLLNLASFLSKVSKMWWVSEDFLGQWCRAPSPPLLLLYSFPMQHRHLKQCYFRNAYLKCSLRCAVCALPSPSPHCLSPNQRSSKVLGTRGCPQQLRAILKSSELTVSLTKLKITEGNFCLDVVEVDSVVLLPMWTQGVGSRALQQGFWWNISLAVVDAQ